MPTASFTRPISSAQAARAFGLAREQVTVLVHSGSRGLGHQVCTDYVRLMDAQLTRYRIHLPDRQLACAPASSSEGRRYLAAMAAAANFAWANRQAIADAVRRAIADVLGENAAAGTVQVYDVAHNVAKVERYKGRELLVHRKGATHAFPAGSSEIPEPYRAVGQPVFIPGSMGTSSFVLAGAPGSIELAFGTTCHGAGRRLFRTGARKQITGAELRRQLQALGIVVRSPSNKGLAEEAPLAYKDVERVVDVVWSDGRKPGPDGKLPSVGSTVDVANATWTNTIGDPELIGFWTDPEFNAAERAFYYVRVLEIPTPRWTAYDAKRYGVQPEPGTRMTITERAYTSPIWYNP